MITTRIFVQTTSYTVLWPMKTMKTKNPLENDQKIAQSQSTRSTQRKHPPSKPLVRVPGHIKTKINQNAIHNTTIHTMLSQPVHAFAYLVLIRSFVSKSQTQPKCIYRSHSPSTFTRTVWLNALCAVVGCVVA